jgi:ligand-binding sensor domain-containing protein
MIKYISHIQVFTLLTLLIFCTSCKGQVTRNYPEDKANESKTISVGHPKLIKNLGSLKDKGHNVHASLQDKAGNLWFSTTGDGVYKYDGKSFTQYTTSNGLKSNTVWCIFEDKSGKIWIGTDDGVCLYDPSKTLKTSENKFSKIQISILYETLNSEYSVWSIMQDKSGKLWFATTIGVYVYDGKSFNFFKVTDDVKDCYANIEKILEDNEGNFWFGGRCHDGVYRYDPSASLKAEGKSITKIEIKKLYEDSPLRERNWAFPQLQDKNGNIWFSNWDGVYRYDGKSFTTFTKKDGLSGNMVCRIKEDTKGNIWFGGAGLTRYDGKSFTRFTTKDGLLNESVWSILEDKTGAIWVGTRETILHRFDGKTFTSYSEEGTQTESVIEDKKGNLWTTSGVGRSFEFFFYEL